MELITPTANSVAAGVLILAGTRDEHWPKEAGIAQALEHMHFQGTKKFPSSELIDGYIEEVGGRLNAGTSNEMTFYEVYIPAEHIRRGVEILSQQMGAATFPRTKIAVEMKTIIQEIRQRNDSPPELIDKIYNELVYGDHPLGKDTLGTEDAVAAFKREDFLTFKDRFYTSKNMVFITAGRIEDEAAVGLFDEFFLPVPGERNTRQPVKLSDSSAKVKIEARDIEQVHLKCGACAGAAASRDSAVLDLFGHMISGGASFPLFQEVRDKRGLCYEINGGLEKGTDVSNFNISMGTSPKQYEEAIDTVLDVIHAAKSDGTLLERAKTSWIGNMTLHFENMLDVITCAAEDITYLGAPRGYEQVRSEIIQVTITEVEKVVDKYLSREKFSRAMLVPQGFQVPPLI